MRIFMCMVFVVTLDRLVSQMTEVLVLHPMTELAEQFSPVEQDRMVPP